MARVIVDPVTRIEGHLRIEAEVDASGVITDSWASGEMARGLEKMLAGRDPRDATYVTERVCGVCTGSHGWASSIAVERAQGTTKLPELARILRNLILSAVWLHDKPLHFYHLSALDYLDLAVLVNYSGTDPYILKIKELITANQAGPLLPRYAPDKWSISDLGLVVHCVQSYLTALTMQAKAKKMAAIFSGKQPHQSGIVAGGVTELPTSAQISAFRSLLAELDGFIRNTYVSDVMMLGTGPLLNLAKSSVGVGYQNYLSVGGFPTDSTNMHFVLPAGAIIDGQLLPATVDPVVIEANISEDVKYGWYQDSDGGDPYTGGQNFNLDKLGAYTFVKAPRFAGLPMEVGPLARMMVARARGNTHPAVTDFANLLAQGVQPGAVARHAARALEALMVLDAMYPWLDELEGRIAQGDTVIHDTAHWNPPASGQGYGLVEAPRGALGHWSVITNYLTSNYSMVVPTTWNASPRDTNGVIGPIEKALIGCPVPDINNPNNIVRIIRSFDPCIACAIHLIHPKSDKIRWFAIR
ncbi:MAG: nickel-dependent hydrogenase large subunit [Clostridia bacterium]|nr:nickel-dependent hydrogenase large subunit [Clostridia bacterium]MDQ7791902.1 nickel-dependent hydrogenase large subunit [Clostridia bacterium]